MLSAAEKLAIRLKTGWSDRILSNIGSVEESSIYMRAEAGFSFCGTHMG